MGAGPAGTPVVVRDHGLGILPEDFPRFSSPTCKAGQFLPNRVIRGTGLGLAICKQIVEAHGGTVQINSSPAPGSEAHPRREGIQECVVEVVVDLPLQVQHNEGGSGGGE